MKDSLLLLSATIDATKSNIPKVNADGVLAGVLSTVYWAAGITAVIVIIIAGILYATSDGDANKVKRAKDAILYSVVGLMFVMMAFLITKFVIGWF